MTKEQDSKNHYKKFTKAFSLIEISVVMLIIAILIAGISQGFEMAYDMRIATARSFSKNAPMASIEGMELWLETTGESSLALDQSSTASIKNSEDNQPIGKWNDIKIQGTTRYHAVQSTLANKPLFKKDGINKLPALYFDGVDDSLESSQADVANNAVNILNNFTIFLVANPLSTCTIGSGTFGGTSGQKYVVCPKQGDAYYGYGGGVGAGTGISLCTNCAGVVEHTSNYMPIVANSLMTINKPVQVTVKYSQQVPYIYVNSGSPSIGGASSKTVFPSFSFGGNGCYGFFKGYVGEIIIYAGDLGDNDRKLIEKYLMDKWRITN